MSLTKAYLLVFGSFVWLIAGGIGLALIKPSGERVPIIALLCLFGVFSILYLTGAAVWAAAKGHHLLWGIGPNVVGPIVVGMIATRFDFQYAVYGPLIMPLPGLLMLLLLPNQNAARTEPTEKNSEADREWELNSLAKRVALLEQLAQSPADAAAARQRIEFTGNTVAQYHARTMTMLKNYCDASPAEKFKQRAEALLEQVRVIEVPAP